MDIRMKRQEYEKALTALERQIDHSEAITEIMVEKLNELYEYKPVSNFWHRLKCKLYIKQGRAEEIAYTYEDMVCRESKSKDNIKLWQEYIHSLISCDRLWEANQQKYMMTRLLQDRTADQIDKELNADREKFVAGNESLELLTCLEEKFYVSCDIMMAYFVFLYRVSLYPDTFDLEKKQKYMSFDNMTYLTERIEAKDTIIIISDKKRTVDYDVLVYLLNRLGIKPYFIGETIEIEEEFSLKDSVAVSMENRQELEDCIYIPAISQKVNGGFGDTNIPYIVDNICSQSTDKDFAMVIANNRLQEKLRGKEGLAKRYERLSDRMASYTEDKIGFGWAGDYYTYISNLYGYDVRESVDRQAECDFSIVVPVRNATETLYYTLKTCVEQEYEGSYEVVLSDNSVDGDDAAYTIYKKLNDKHIRYCKTPRQLRLAKSYEYAYLQTKGKYIIPIGADDALFPWTLSTLSYVWNREEVKSQWILSWVRGFYAWPGFNGGQENQLTIPGFYKKGNIQCSIERSSEYFEMLKKNPSYMYALPNMYINSAFKRDYMQVLYEKTGRLLDGYSQDIYMGVQNLMLNENFLYIKYPLSIAGMSSSSVGATTSRMSRSNDSKDIKNVNLLNGGQGLNCLAIAEYIEYVPWVGSDVSDMYLQMYYLIEKGIVPANLVSDNDQMNMFVKCFESISKLDDKLENHIEVGRYSASLRGTKFLSWYEQNYQQICRGELIKYSQKQKDIDFAKKRYVEGFSENGGVVLDASRFGVTNVYEAVQLFKDFLHFS